MPGRQHIGIGTVANDDTGDTGRASFDKCNDNFIELYDRTVVSVKEHGATGDSTTDDYTAIKAAYDAAAALTPKGVVLFPQGTYKMGTTLAVSTAGVKFIGHEAKIAPNAIEQAFNVTARARFDGLEFDGTNLTAPTAAWSTGNTPKGVSIWIKGTSGSEVADVQIRNCEFTAEPACAILGDFTDRLVITNCRFNACATSATNTISVIRVNAGIETRITNNQIHDTPDVSGLKCIAINNANFALIANNVISCAGAPNTNGNPIYSKGGNDVSIVGNVCRDGGVNGVKLSAGSVRCTVAANTIEGSAGIRVQGASQCLIDGNVIRDTSTDPDDAGIIVQTHLTDTTDILDVQVIGNYIHRTADYTAFTDVDGAGIIIQGQTALDCRRITVSDNTIDGAHQGILMQNPTDATQYQDIVIRNNRVRRTTSYNIKCAAVDGLIIDGNHCDSPNTNGNIRLTTSFAGTVGRTAITNNFCRTAATTAIQADGTTICDELEISGNLVDGATAGTGIRVQSQVPQVDITSNRITNVSETNGIDVTITTGTMNVRVADNVLETGDDIKLDDSGGGTLNATVRGNIYDIISTSPTTGTLTLPAAHIADPSGGATQDAEARTAINAILVVLETAKLTKLS